MEEGVGYARLEGNVTTVEPRLSESLIIRMPGEKELKTEMIFIPCVP